MIVLKINHAIISVLKIRSTTAISYRNTFNIRYLTTKLITEIKIQEFN